MKAFPRSIVPIEVPAIPSTSKSIPINYKVQKKYTATRFPLSIVPIEIPDIFAKAKKEIKEHCEKYPAHLGKGVSPMKAFQKRFENLNGTINSVGKNFYLGYI